MISDGSAEAAAPALLLLGTLRNRLGFTACAEQAPAAMQDIPYWQGHGFRLRWALSSCLRFEMLCRERLQSSRTPLDVYATELDSLIRGSRRVQYVK